MTNKAELEKTAEVVREELGSCDILLNGAGGNQPGAITSIEMLGKEAGAEDESFWNLDEDKIIEMMVGRRLEEQDEIIILKGGKDDVIA